MLDDISGAESSNESVGSSPGSRRGGNVLRFSTNLQTWASEYPFPTFKPPVSRRKAARAQRAGQLPTPDYGDNTPDEQLHDDKASSCSSEDDRRTVTVLAPHPLASDLTIAHHRTRWSTHLELCEQQRRNGGVGQPSTNRSMAPVAHLSQASLLASQGGGCPPVGREEVSALLAITATTGSTTAVSDKVHCAHTDLRWLHGPAVTAPACHLHLGSLHLRIDDDGGETAGGHHHHQALINSPRSALVLLRRGTKLTSLLRRPWAKKRFNHSATFGALDTLTMTERREYVLEQLRQRRLEEATEDYDQLCRVTSYEDVMALARDILDASAKRKQLAMVRPSSSVSRAANASVSSQVEALAVARPSSGLSFLRKRLQDVRSVSDASIMQSPMMVRSRRLAEQADQTLHKIAERERTTRRILRVREAQRQEKLVLNDGKSELVREQQRTTVSALGYRRVVLDQYNKQRSNEADAFREAMFASSIELADAKRRANILESRVVSHKSMMR